MCVERRTQMYFLALYLKRHIELILLCCVYSAININFGGEWKSKGRRVHLNRQTSNPSPYAQSKLSLSLTSFHFVCSRYGVSLPAEGVSNWV